MYMLFLAQLMLAVAVSLTTAISARMLLTAHTPFVTPMAVYYVCVIGLIVVASAVLMVDAAERGFGCWYSFVTHPASTWKTRVQFLVPCCRQNICVPFYFIQQP